MTTILRTSKINSFISISFLLTDIYNFAAISGIIITLLLQIEPKP